MQIVIENSVIQEALRVVTKLAPPVSGNVTITSDGKKIFMHSNSEVSRCSVNMPAEVSGKAANFAIALTTLRDATKGRSKLVISYDKTLCKVKSGNYTGDLATVDAVDMEQETEEKGEAMQLTGEQATWLRSAVSTVALKPTALLASFMPVSIKLTSKGAFVACYDSNHMAYINSSEITGDMQLRLPLDTLSNVLDAFNNGPCKLQLSKANLYVSNKLVKVVLALPQEDEADIKIEDIINLAKGSKEAKGAEFETEKVGIAALLDNARAVATKERSEIKLIPEAGKLRLEVTTTNGTVKGVVKASCKQQGKVLVDFEFFDEAIRKSGESVVIKVVKSEFISFKLKNGTVIVSLNQEA